MYRSLAEVQIEREEDIARHPVSRPEGPVPQTPAELLYQVRNLDFFTGRSAEAGLELTLSLTN